MRSYWLLGPARCGGKSRGTAWTMRAFCNHTAKCLPLVVKVNLHTRTIAEHLAALLSHAEVLLSVTIAVDVYSLSLILATVLVAINAIPPFDISAMDCF